MDHKIFLFAFFLFSIGYILGSIPFGLLISKLSGHGDIRKIGSGNIGATNVLRTGNKMLALLTVLLDGGKAAVPIMIFYYFNPPKEWYMLPEEFFRFWALFLGFSTIVGHCFPVWLKFKGGKGYATTLGTLLAAVPLAGLATILTWIGIVAITRLSSLGALISTIAAPIATFFIYGNAPAAICCLITLLVWARHKDNIKRLIKGEETKIGTKT